MSTAKKPARKPAAGKTKDDDIHPVARPFMWLLDERVRNGFMYFIGFATLISIAADFFIKRHGHFHFEEYKGFFAFFGFASFAFVVLMGWPLRRLTGRSEEYYPESTEDD